jgi:hypothetical protein
LLPEENPNSLINVPYGDVNNIYICRDEPGFSIHVSGDMEDLLDYYHESDIRQAWSYADIRLYLLDKGYIVDITPFITDKNVNYDVVILNINNMTDNFKGDFSPEPIFLNAENVFATYEEAREAAVKHCLELETYRKKL